MTTADFRRAKPWRAYLHGTAMLERLAPAFLRWRLRHGKENASRLGERLGQAAVPRPEGALVWLHGASVGEGLALLPLIERLRAANLGVLVTTGTVTSAAVLTRRLPEGALHQFVPLDGPKAARRFLDHWRPDLVVFAESELWPNLLGEAGLRGVPVALVNARMSARSFGRWERVPALAASLLGAIDLILAQSEDDAKRYTALGARTVASTGNLKFDAAPPPAMPDALETFRAASAGRPVWVAASTHAGEDLLCCQVHATLAERLPDLLTIVVPRRVDRAADILAEATRLGLVAAARSRSMPVTPETAVYVADTMGELGLFYRLQTVVFVGKSLGPGRGGQNPIEPAKLGNAILHGPAVHNFIDVYALLDACGGARPVDQIDALADAVSELLTDDAKRVAMARAARNGANAAAGAADRTLAALARLAPAVFNATVP